MEKRKLPLLCLVILSFFYSFAQDTEKASNWYWRERFVAADVNENAFLEKAELAKFPLEFAYYLDSRNFSTTDENRDGELSFNEMSAKESAEIAYRTTMENRQVRSLETAYPQLAKNPLVFLKSNPSVAATLFGNLTWMMNHANVVSEICKDTKWLNEQPNVAYAINHNLCWMASNPGSAKYLYENMKESFASPELLGWRSEHIKFLRQNTALNNFYTIDGYKD